MKKTLALLTLTSLLFTGCHTAIWQDVNSEIEGTWTLQPAAPGNTFQFTFQGGELSFTLNGNPVPLQDLDGTVTYPSVEYRVQKQINNHYVIIDKLFFEKWGFGIIRYNVFDIVDRWLVVTVNENELYLSSEGETGLKGEFQYHFFKTQ